jgi:hypothetical protein
VNGTLLAGTHAPLELAVTSRRDNFDDPLSESQMP